MERTAHRHAHIHMTIDGQKAKKKSDKKERLRIPWNRSKYKKPATAVIYLNNDVQGRKNSTGTVVILNVHKT